MPMIKHGCSDCNKNCYKKFSITALQNGIWVVKTQISAQCTNNSNRSTLLVMQKVLERCPSFSNTTFVHNVSTQNAATSVSHIIVCEDFALATVNSHNSTLQETMTMRELMTATLYSNRNLTDCSKQKSALKYPHILSFQQVQNALSRHLIFL